MYLKNEEEREFDDELTYEDQPLKLDWHLYHRWQQRCVRWTSWTRVQSHGLEKINKRGVALITPNHSSWKDILFIGGMIRRIVHFVATYRLFDENACHAMLEEDKFFGKLAHFPVIREPIYMLNYLLSRFLVSRVPSAGAIPAKLQTGGYSLFDAVKSAFHQEKLVCIFPEGRSSKEIRRFKLGIAKVLLDYYQETRISVPVYPVGITGTHRIYRPRMRLGFFVGSPIYIKDYLESTDFKTYVSFTNALKEEVVRLVNQN